MPRSSSNDASWQAQVGFYLSLALAAFQLFQFFHSETEASISSSIDFAKKTLSDPDIAKGRGVAIKLRTGAANLRTLPASDIEALNRFTLNAGYEADLLVQKRLIPEYLTTKVTCDIWLSIEVAKKTTPGVHVGNSAAAKFAPLLDNDCSAMFPM